MKYSARLVFLLFGLKIVASQNSEYDDSVYFPGDNPLRGPSINKGDLLPSDCGLGVQIENRIVNGENAGLGEFPWMVALQYQLKSGIIELDCGGTLINNRYVLTAAHCVRVTSKKLHAARLREYNTKTYIDCVNGVCSDPPVIHNIEEEIVHEKYVRGSSDQHNDIALLRLKSPVTPSNFAKPICMPQSHKLSPDLIATGWGYTGTADAPLDVLQKVTLPLADRHQCENWYKNLANPASLIDGQFCAGGVDYKDTCKGDSGGPVMQFDYARSRYEIVGITSYGSSFCGENGVPSVYTKVYSYMPWILSKIRP